MQSFLKLIFLLPVVLVAASPVEVPQPETPQAQASNCLIDCSWYDSRDEAICTAVNVHPYCNMNCEFKNDIMASCKKCTCTS